MLTETHKPIDLGNGGKLGRGIGFLSEKINTFGSFVSGLFILVMGVIISYEVVMRYLFSAPTSWVLEISINLCIGSVFLAGGYALKEKSHIQVDALTQKFSKRNQILLELICLLLTLLYCSVLTWKGAETAIHSFLLGEVSPTVLNIPVVIPRGFVPIGGLLLIIELIRQILVALSALGNVRREDESGGKRWLRYLPPLIFLALLIGCGALFLSKDLTPLGLTLLVFVLIFAGMPIAFALGLLGLIGFTLTFGGGPMLAQIPLVTYKILDDFIIVAVPLFLMLSAILSIGRIGFHLFEFASTWVRHLPGGLGVATIFACAIFAAMCGSSVATVATIGLIAIPEMLSRGYKRELVFGTVAIGGVLGPLIPPSIYMILIGAITGDSVGKLFMAGMLPGILLAVIFSAYIIIRSMRDKTFPRVEPSTWKERWEAIKKAFLGLLAPIIVLGGIYTGVFTPSEAAGVGMVYSLLICAFIHRTLSLKKLGTIILDGGRLTSAILLIVAGAIVFGQLVSMLQIPEKTCGFLASLPLSPMTILFLALILILILGALMDEASILLITYPTLYYIFVKTFGFDSIWFALVFVFTLEVGLVAPPVGINVFVVQGIWKDAKFEEVVKGVLPFALLMVLAILLVVYIKPLSLWLPKWIG
jgi:C4-dicarboxylate transporter DctM subunit